MPSPLSSEELVTQGSKVSHPESQSPLAPSLGLACRTWVSTIPGCFQDGQKEAEERWRFAPFLHMSVVVPSVQNTQAMVCPSPAVHHCTGFSRVERLFRDVVRPWASLLKEDTLTVTHLQRTCCNPQLQKLRSSKLRFGF